MPRRLRGASAIAASVVVVVCVAVQSSGATVSSRGAPRDSDPADAGTKAPKSNPPICPASRAADPAYKFTQPFHGGRSPTGDACGTNHDDSMKVVDLPTGGTQVWAGPGNDKVDSNNKKIDEIWGGADNNSATIDWCLPNGKVHDTVHNVAHVKKVKVKCTDVTSTSSRRTAAELTYPYVEPDVLCTVDPTSGQRLVTIPHEPAIRAVDATANVDWQTVAFTALLYMKKGGTWVFSKQSPWVWDRAPDEQLEDFGPNFWVPFGGTSHVAVSFNPTSAGEYRVAIRYQWYAANGIPDHDILDWASYHFGHYGSPGEDSCNFPGPPPPDGSYTGTTDESKVISFNAAPIWSGAPRDVGGSRLTDVTVRSSLTCSPSGTLNYMVTAGATRWIQLNADNTFSYVRVGSINDSNTARTNVVGSYFLAGKIDTAGNAAGTLYFQQLSYDQGGTHFTCTGTSHSWTAKRAS